MTCRMVRSLAASALVLAVPVTAVGQGRGAMEFGAIGRFTDFDNSLAMKPALGVGARAAVSIGPRFAFELDLSSSSAGRQGGGASVTYAPLHARVVGVFPAGGRIDALLGGGYVHNAYSGGMDAGDGGLSGLLGLRYQATNRVSLRLGLDLDLMFHTSADSPFTFYNGNWSLQLGAAARLNGGGGGGDGGGGGS
jgi:hypothetical protein